MIRRMVRNPESRMRAIVAEAAPKLLPAPTTDDTGSLLATSGRAYARYLGPAPRQMSSITAIAYVAAAAAVAGAGGASVNWAEVALATGTYAYAASIDLTILAAASIDTEVKAGAAVSVAKTLSGFDLAPGTDLWLVVAAAYESTQASFRIPSGVNVDGTTRIRASTRPSTNLNTPLAFAWTVGAGLAVPWMRAIV